jgi:transcriptional regulator NrdR family protein
MKAVKVVKRDDRREDFEINKVRRAIERTAEKADIDKNMAKEIADRVARDVEEHFKDRNEVKSVDIRDRVLRELDSEEKKMKKIADSFRNFKK